MTTNTAPFYAFPFDGVLRQSEIDFFKKPTQEPRAVKAAIDWRVLDDRYFKLFGETISPYSVNMDIAYQQSATIAEIKGVYIDNSDCIVPLLFECVDTGQQIKIEAFEQKFCPLLTTQTLFRITNLLAVRRNYELLTSQRMTTIYFVNTSIDGNNSPRHPMAFNFGASLNLNIASATKRVEAIIFDAYTRTVFITAASLRGNYLPGQGVTYDNTTLAVELFLQNSAGTRTQIYREIQMLNNQAPMQELVFFNRAPMKQYVPVGQSLIIAAENLTNNYTATFRLTGNVEVEYGG